jgi:hypothetical protein
MRINNPGSKDHIIGNKFNGHDESAFENIPLCLMRPQKPVFFHADKRADKSCICLEAGK